ncbi:MAG: DNA replication and repair protein RecF, partial [Actinobacteria bacterium]
YERLELRPARHVTVLTGPNAAGKTNALEAVSLACRGASFRRMAPADAVRWGSDIAVVEAVAEGENGPVTVRLEAPAAGRRRWSVNGKVKRSSADLAGLVPVVSFTPDDLGMVKGSADARRDALDALGSSLSAGYAKAVAEYGRVVRQRNALLRDENADRTAMVAWDERLAEAGGRLGALRLRLLARVVPAAAEAHSSVGGEALAVTYESTWAGGATEADELAARIRDGLRERQAEERARKATLTGPHRDDLAFSIGGHDARAFASQGQQRTAVLAWKMAEVAVVREVAARTPVLLLDDVMSELDAGRRDALTALLGEDTQALITTTNIGYFSSGLLDGAAIVEVGPA